MAANLVASVRIVKLAGETVWQCKAYGADGRRMPAADCEETSRPDAEHTAAAMVRPYAEQTADDARRIVAALPVSGKYADDFKSELRHYIDVSADSFDGSETLTARQFVAYALLVMLAMGDDFGGAYGRGNPPTAENGGLACRANYKAAARILPALM